MKDVVQQDTIVPEILVSVFNLFSEPIIIASADTKVLYANQPAARHVGLEMPEDLIGKFYDEIQLSLILKKSKLF